EGLVAIELAAAVAQVGVAIFETGRDPVCEGMLNAAAHEPPVAVFASRAEAGGILDRCTEPRVGVTAASVEQSIVGHQIPGPRREVDRTLRIDRYKRGASVAREAVIDAEIQTDLGADHEARSDLVVIACEHTG